MYSAEDTFHISQTPDKVHTNSPGLWQCLNREMHIIRGGSRFRSKYVAHFIDKSSVLRIEGAANHNGTEIQRVPVIR
jgi:hypothetical protein